MWNAICGFIGKLMQLIYSVVPNYGVAIILFTIILKVILFPIAVKQQKSSMAMVRLKPYQDDLMKKYGGNRQKYSEELQKLYQREGYNPMSSCLPLLLQMPILFMMYTIIRRPLTFMANWSMASIWQKATTEFGVITEKGTTMLNNMGGLSITSENFNRYESQILSKMQNPPINTHFLGLDLAQVPSEVWKTSAFMIIIIPLLSGITSFLLSWLSQKMSPAQQASAEAGGSMKVMLFAMPLFSLWISFTVPAGLGIYWILSNVWGIGQLFLLNKIYDPKKVEAEVYAKMEADKKREKEKKSASARKKAMAVQGKKKKKKQSVKPKTEATKQETAEPEDSEGEQHD